jgi:hypothetical protein
MVTKMQTALFHESINDALKDIINHAGGTKSVGARLYPEKTPDSAARTLLDALNENRPEKLSPEQFLFILKLGREFNCHSAINYIARETGYSDPMPIDPDDQKAKLMRDFITAQKAMSAITEKLNSLGGFA